MRSDLVILLGVIVASLVNSITTEGLGAGVNVSAIWLFVIASVADDPRPRPASGAFS